ncbi:hypothetical protein PoB_006274700 [Plakobranchus ocellatus]|uniref:Secreted protein n=1 Tax=Plakobranchus ocellatus TaxID=259542 RepID=A0AAV4CWF9_9GAST|nr:hypothetical protein PoB_006274700 [Plakobranchus ocellatus]
MHTIFICFLPHLLPLTQAVPHPLPITEVVPSPLPITQAVSFSPYIFLRDMYLATFHRNSTIPKASSRHHQTLPASTCTASFAATIRHQSTSATKQYQRAQVATELAKGQV